MWATPSFSSRLVIGSSLSPSLRPDSIGTKFGGKPGHKPGGKKPFKPYNSTEKKNRPGKGGDAGKKQNKFVVSKAGNVQQKRKLPFKGKKEGGEGEGEKTCATLQCSLSWFSLHVSSLLNILASQCFHSRRLQLLDSQLFTTSDTWHKPPSNSATRLVIQVAKNSTDIQKYNEYTLYNCNTDTLKNTFEQRGNFPGCKHALYSHYTGMISYRHVGVVPAAQVMLLQDHHCN